jgi:hypothetical protein
LSSYFPQIDQIAFDPKFPKIYFEELAAQAPNFCEVRLVCLVQTAAAARGYLVA